MPSTGIIRHDLSQAPHTYCIPSVIPNLMRSNLNFSQRTRCPIHGMASQYLGITVMTTNLLYCILLKDCRELLYSTLWPRPETLILQALTSEIGPNDLAALFNGNLCGNGW